MPLDRAAPILEVVKADADLADMMRWVSCCAQTNQNVHLAHEAFGSVCQSEPHLAMPPPRLELVEQEQGLPIHVDVDAAITLAPQAGHDLHVL